MDVSKSSDSLLEDENLLTPKTPVRITFRRFSIEVSVPYSKKNQKNATNKVEITKIDPMWLVCQKKSYFICDEFSNIHTNYS